MFGAWVYSSEHIISSISSEELAVRLAEKYPEAIYFFAEMVTHPNKED